MRLVPTHPRRIFLVGPMGVGKTTIGKMLARELGLKFIDCDQEIERRSGANVAWIFDVEGEAGFRDRESQILSLSFLLFLVCPENQARRGRQRNCPPCFGRLLSFFIF